MTDKQMNFRDLPPEDRKEILEGLELMTKEITAQTNELKPCPFCGGAASIRHEPDVDALGNYAYVECSKCSASSAHRYASYGNDCPQRYREVKGDWNTRTSDTTLITALRDLKDMVETIAITAQQASMHEPEQFCSWAYNYAGEIIQSIDKVLEGKE